ncbi:MAG: HAMP domain-containing protein [Xanthomonadaceae bacterium]|nr:HAMP domain-containing protein [Xanthomonadaceae bacterium]
MTGRLSYRVRVPLSLIATSALTALVLGVVIAVHTYHNLQQDLVTGARQLGSAMVTALGPALKHEDIWLAYTILRGPREEAGNDPAEMVLLDENLNVFASNQPKRYPTALPLARTNTALAKLPDRLADGLPSHFSTYDRISAEHLVAVVPVLADDIAVGVLVISHPSGIFWPRFWDIAYRGLLSILIVLVVIAAIGWYWGDRMVRPLTRLASCMSRVGQEPLDHIQCELSSGNDEIGRLEQGFRQMLNDLRNKASLEREMVVSERLSALGRLVAGVAHEINNPLAGLIVAVNTLKRHGTMDPQTERTVTLIERGLQQIRETVAALMVEARMEAHPLSHQDIDDVRTLVATHCEKRQVTLLWHNHLEGSIKLPSTPVRQVLLNLVLNAIDATQPGGDVACEVETRGQSLSISVANNGTPIPPERIEHLFEPFYSTRRKGIGLGLWITYQIVQQLHGDIDVKSNAQRTCFHVVIPLASTAGEQHAA